MNAVVAGAVTGWEPMHRMADPFQANNIVWMREGESSLWHYDFSDVTVALLLEEPQEGGLFEFVDRLRATTRRMVGPITRVCRPCWSGGTHGSRHSREGRARSPSSAASAPSTRSAPRPTQRPPALCCRSTTGGLSVLGCSGDGSDVGASDFSHLLLRSATRLRGLGRDQPPHLRPKDPADAGRRSRRGIRAPVKSVKQPCDSDIVNLHRYLFISLSSAAERLER